jgi:hypothetical protein
MAGGASSATEGSMTQSAESREKYNVKRKAERRQAVREGKKFRRDMTPSELSAHYAREDLNNKIKMHLTPWFYDANGILTRMLYRKN